MNVEKEASSFVHHVSGTLKSGYSGSAQKTISLEPLNSNPTTCQIQVAFDGDNPTSATAYMTINQTQYAVSTTVRYGFKPAGNSIMLAVSPQSTEATTPTKTPEQLQHGLAC